MRFGNTATALIGLCALHATSASACGGSSDQDGASADAASEITSEKTCIDICHKLSDGHCEGSVADCSLRCVKVWQHCGSWLAALACFDENASISCIDSGPACQAELDELKNCEAALDGGIYQTCKQGDIIPACTCDGGDMTSAYPCLPSGKFVPCCT